MNACNSISAINQPIIVCAWDIYQDQVTPELLRAYQKLGFFLHTLLLCLPYIVSLHFCVHKIPFMFLSTLL